MKISWQHPSEAQVDWLAYHKQTLSSFSFSQQVKHAFTIIWIDIILDMKKNASIQCICQLSQIIQESPRYRSNLPASCTCTVRIIKSLGTKENKYFTLILIRSWQKILKYLMHFCGWLGRALFSALFFFLGGGGLEEVSRSKIGNLLNLEFYRLTLVYSLQMMGINSQWECNHRQIKYFHLCQKTSTKCIYTCQSLKWTKKESV